MFGTIDRRGSTYLSTMPPPVAGPAAVPVTGSPSIASGQYSAAATAGGNANVSVAILVGISLALLLGFHLLGFRFGFDVSVGRS